MSDVYVNVFSGSSARAAVVVAFLEGHGICTQLESQYFGTIDPPAASPGGVGAVGVCVLQSHAQEATALLRERKALR